MESDEQLPAELGGVAERLRAERPRASALEVDRIKVRALQRGSVRTPTAARGQRGSIMRSRLAILAVVVVGILFCGGGAALATSGLSSTGNAAVSQYGGNDHGTSGSIGSGGGDAPTAHAQAAAQTAGGDGGSLPFTGYAAIPVLVIGVVLLAGGAALGWRVRRTE